MPCAQRVSGNRRIRGARLGRRLVSGAPLSPKGFGARGLLTFDNRVFSMQPRKGTGYGGPVSGGGFPLLGKEAPLNRKQLVDAIQKHTEVARADIDKVLGSLIQHTQVAVKKGDRVSLVGFGTFERRDRKARVARNPRSGETVKVKATKVPVFRAGQSFRDVVAGKAAAPKLTAPRGTKAAARSAGAKTTAKATTAKATTARGKATTSRAKAAPRAGAQCRQPTSWRRSCSRRSRRRRLVTLASRSLPATARRSSKVSTSKARAGSSQRTAPGTARCRAALPGPKSGANEAGSRQASRLVPAPSRLGTTTTGAPPAATATRPTASALASGRSAATTSSPPAASRRPAARVSERLSPAAPGSSSTTRQPMASARCQTSRSGEITTGRSSPVAAWSAATTSSSMAIASSRRSTGLSHGASRPLASARALTGTSGTGMTETVLSRQHGPPSTARLHPGQGDRAAGGPLLGAAGLPGGAQHPGGGTGDRRRQPHLLFRPGVPRHLRRLVRPPGALPRQGGAVPQARARSRPARRGPDPRVPRQPRRLQGAGRCGGRHAGRCRGGDLPRGHHHPEPGLLAWAAEERRGPAGRAHRRAGGACRHLGCATAVHAWEDRPVPARHPGGAARRAAAAPGARPGRIARGGQRRPGPRHGGDRQARRRGQGRMEPTSLVPPEAEAAAAAVTERFQPG